MEDFVSLMMLIFDLDPEQVSTISRLYREFKENGYGLEFLPYIVRKRLKEGDENDDFFSIVAFNLIMLSSPEFRGLVLKDIEKLPIYKKIPEA